MAATGEGSNRRRQQQEKAAEAITDYALEAEGLLCGDRFFPPTLRQDAAAWKNLRNRYSLANRVGGVAPDRQFPGQSDLVLRRPPARPHLKSEPARRFLEQHPIRDPHNKAGTVGKRRSSNGSE